MEEGPEARIKHGTGQVGKNNTCHLTGVVWTEGEEGTEANAGVLTDDRWILNDGSSDLAERGLQIVGAGLYMPTASTVSAANVTGSESGSKRSRQTWTGEQEAEVSAKVVP